MTNPQPLPPEVLVELEGDLAWLRDQHRLDDLEHNRRINRLISTARSTEAMRAEIGDIYGRLRNGTLHEPHCNTMGHGRVGAAGSGCSCALGYEISAMRAENERLTEEKLIAERYAVILIGEKQEIAAENERLKLFDAVQLKALSKANGRANALALQLKAAREALEKARKHLIYIEEGCAGGGLSAHMAGRTAKAGIDLIDATFSTITPTGDEDV